MRIALYNCMFPCRSVAEGLSRARRLRPPRLFLLDIVESVLWLFVVRPFSSLPHHVPVLVAL